MRTFVALRLPETFVYDLAMLARQLSNIVDGRFVKAENYHVTLAFLGELSDADCRKVMGALDGASTESSPVLLSSESLGTFGRKKDKTLWLGLRQEPAMMALADSVRERLSTCGLSFDKKRFLPHITLARHAHIPRAELPALAFPADAIADTIVVYKSILAPQGASYKELYAVPLKTSLNDDVYATYNERDGRS